jgi:ribosomal protein S18
LWDVRLRGGVGWVIADVSKASVASLKHSAAMNNSNVNLLWHFLWILEDLKIKAKRSFETSASTQRRMSSFIVSK